MMLCTLTSHQLVIECMSDTAGRSDADRDWTHFIQWFISR